MKEVALEEKLANFLCFRSCSHLILASRSCFDVLALAFKMPVEAICRLYGWSYLDVYFRANIFHAHIFFTVFVRGEKRYAGKAKVHL